MGKKEIIDSLKLVKRSQENADADGWVPVSSQLTEDVYPFDTGMTIHGRISRWVASCVSKFSRRLLWRLVL